MTDEALGSWKAQLDGRWNSERWQISSLVLDGADGAHLEASGGGPSTDLAHARHQLDVSWRSLGWPLDHPGIVSPRGSLSVAGSLDGYRFELNGELVPPGTPPLALQALDDGTLDQAQQLGLRPMIWSPLGGGRLFNGDDPQAMRVRQAMQPIAERHGISLATLAYAWILRHPCRPHPITGSGRIDGLREAVAALDITLDGEDWYAIWTASQGHPVP